MRTALESAMTNWKKKENKLSHFTLEPLKHDTRTIPTH